MNKRIIAPFILLPTLLSGCGGGASSNSMPLSKNDEVALPSVFYDTNFAVVSGNWNENGCALIIGHKGEIEIQNVSAHNDFVDIEFDLLPIYLEEDGQSKRVIYFLPFLVKEEVIDDGYFKNGKEYRFYLRYDDPGYYCAVSLNDPTIQTPDKVLMEGYM